MRVLQVINTLKTGGAEKLLTEIVPLMNCSDIQVDVLTFIGGDTPFAKQLKEKGVKVYSFYERGSVYNPIIIFKLIRFIKQYDIVHTHNTSPQLFTAIASTFGKTTLVTTEHSTFNRRRNNRIFRFIDKWMYNRYKTIICISNQVSTQLSNYITRISDRQLIIKNGIEIEKYRQTNPLPNIDHSRFIVCMVAGFRYQKDHETLLRAFRLLDKRRYELWLVGDGSQRQIIENLIKELNLSEQVKLLGIREDIPAILKTVDVVVQSSHIEGFGLAAAEGMAAGKPVIATDVPGLREVVDGAGFLVPHQDANALAESIRQLQDNQELYNSISARCVARSKDFSIDTMADAYIEVYKSI